MIIMNILIWVYYVRRFFGYFVGGKELGKAFGALFFPQCYLHVIMNSRPIHVAQNFAQRPLHNRGYRARRNAPPNKNRRLQSSLKGHINIGCMTPNLEEPCNPGTKHVTVSRSASTMSDFPRFALSPKSQILSPNSRCLKSAKQGTAQMGNRTWEN